MLAESSFRKSSHGPPPGRFYVRGKKHETSQVVCIVIAHDIFRRQGVDIDCRNKNLAGGRIDSEAKSRETKEEQQRREHHD